MIKVVLGNKGIGKTKYIIEQAKELIENSKGDTVFIDNSKELVTELNHKIRLINIREFPIENSDMLFGFICGIIGENYDIETIFIDGLNLICSIELKEVEFFTNIKMMSEKYNVNFIISMDDGVQNIPDFVIKEYSC